MDRVRQTPLRGSAAKPPRGRPTEGFAWGGEGYVVALRADGAHPGEREPELMGRGVKNTEVFPAASMDGFTAARDVSAGSRSPLRAFRVALEHT
jgi:hypothetical protein